MTAADLRASLAQLEHEHLNIMATLNACRGAMQQTKHYISLAEAEQGDTRERVIPFPAVADASAEASV